MTLALALLLALSFAALRRRAALIRLRVEQLGVERLGVPPLARRRPPL